MIRLKQKKKKKYKQLLCSVVLLALTLFVFGFAGLTASAFPMNPSRQPF